MSGQPTLPGFFDVQPPVDDPLRRTLQAMIMDWHNATPRHQQVELGPSEVGHPCMRKVAFGTMAVPECNPQFDPLPSIIGVATHAWLQGAASHANQVLGRQRWLAEQRVQVSGDLAGSCDLFDTDTGTVIDWKVPGSNRFRMYKKDMSPVYRNQSHLYGLGFENAGYQVNTVVVALLPRGGMLKGMHLWSEPYDRARAEHVLSQRVKTICLIDEFDVDVHPERYSWIPAAQYDCQFCEWYAPGRGPAGPLQCRGDGS